MLQITYFPAVHLQTRHTLLSLVLLHSALVACQQTPLPPARPTPLPQDPLIQVYTNHNPASSYTEPYRQQRRSGDDLEQQIVATITAARSTVDVAVQELRLPKVAAALVERHKAGVKIRVILENTYSRPLSDFAAAEIAQLPDREKGRYEEFRRLADQDGNGDLSPTEIAQGDALVMLDQATIPRIDDTADGSAGSNLMHHKFVVVDGQQLIVTSANFTPSDAHGDFKSPASRGNANNLLKITSPELAVLFTQEFNSLWGDGPGGKPNSRFGVKKPFRPARSIVIGSTQVRVQFSPTAPSIGWNHSSNGLIGQTLETATRSIALALFVFSDQRLVNIFEPMHRRGADVQALIDPGFAYRSYSEALDLLGVALAEDCKYEPGNLPWKPAIQSVGVPRMPPGDLLHHKFGIVDQQTVITGSHNWTDAANEGNDETVLVVSSPIVAAHFQREFDRLYTNAILGVPPAIQKKVEAQLRECTQVRSHNLPGSSTADSTEPNLKQAKGVEPGSSSVNSSSQVSTQSLVNLNTATQTELESLPGVGPRLAKKIITARSQGPFSSLEDLDRIPGVSSKLLKRWQGKVTLDSVKSAN